MKDIAPAVKPQMAFYEMYGWAGVLAYQKTVEYAKSKEMLVIGDAKRGDIGNTAQAYAKGHLGKVDIGNGEEAPIFDVDFLTVSPYLGDDTLQPFIDECIKNNKGIFVLAKTSNFGSGYIQDKVDQEGKTIYETVAEYVAQQAERLKIKTGYSPIGAVVGATYPEQALKLRNIMPNNIILVPGYGAQGATAKDVTNSFDKDGLGAIVNSSRGIIYAHKKRYPNGDCTREQYKEEVRKATEDMKKDITQALEKEDKGYNKLDRDR
ncbi:MAG: orotidine-5'-phosphate decarboxylase [Oscillospiraceae bacterium]|nr:orotidine-5'-phosphate decarboxylase [Oscillospiraceae bacterium]